MKKLLAAFLLLFSIAPAYSQGNLELTFGPVIKTNGFGLSSSFLMKESQDFRHSFNLELSTLKHSKEIRIQNQKSVSPKTYFYGKQYRAVQINPAYQILYKEGVSGRNAANLSYGVEVGPSFAVLRPVYLVVLNFDEPENLSPKVEPYDPVQHDNQDEILGDAGWQRGFRELSLKTGIHVSALVNIDWDQDYFRKRLQTGLSLDYFFRDLGIMYRSSNQIFGSFFIRYQIGRSR